MIMRTETKNRVIITGPVNLQLEGITLLSIKEYDEAKEHITPTKVCWWLRSPGYYLVNAAIVGGDGKVTYNGYGVDNVYGVRPALRIILESSNLQIGDFFYFGGHTWTVISDDYALCDETLCNMPFRKHWQAPNANNYEKSDIKRFLDGWYAAQTEPSSETSADDLVSRTKILNYINRVKNSGLGKHKSLEYIEKYVEKMDPGDETSKDTISRQAAIEEIALHDPTNGTEPFFSGHEVVNILKCVPPVAPKRPQGEWIVYPLVDNGRVELECPECGDTFIRAIVYRPHFCENCGADMRGKE